MHINSTFDSGNIEVIQLKSPLDIQCAIRKDSNAAFLQWFHFNLKGAKATPCQIKIVNAGETSYPVAWKDYRACASYDRLHWFRVATQYDGKNLTIAHTPEKDSVYYAYFPPYSYEQHLNLLSWAQLSPHCQLTDLGLTLDGRPLSLLTLGEPAANKRKIWIIARQHAGETMAEWFIEGLLHRLLDLADPVSRTLLKTNVFYVVPNMNPDGSVRGNLRANAAGTDLNRSWAQPSLEKSPEVYYVRNKMKETGVDFFLDAHGDEELPYVFVAGAGANSSFSARQKNLEETFAQHLLLQSPDFQTEYGYAINQFGNQVLTLATNTIADAFDCLALTLEMPFKDNANLPDETTGWSPVRCKKLAHACLDVLLRISPLLR